LADPPQVFQVWFLPDAAQGAQTMSLIATLSGSIRMQAANITWRPSVIPSALRLAFGPGGQVLVRIHCGFLLDSRGLPVSAALDAVTGITSAAPIPGGIFESWFFVTRG